MSTRMILVVHGIRQLCGIRQLIRISQLDLGRVRQLDSIHQLYRAP
jgi:hypothetical protein